MIELLLKIINALDCHWASMIELVIEIVNALRVPSGISDRACS